MRKNRLFIFLALVLIVATVALLTWRLWPGKKRSNVVLIVVDALRSDRLPFYGYDRIETPFLSGLAARSILCLNAWATAPWTAPSTASIFTSLYPFQHGVRYNLGNFRVNRKTTMFRIPDKARTLAETLKQLGYRTFGISMNINVCSDLKFDKGFDRFVTITSKKDAEYANRQLMNWEKEIKKNAPYFVYLHYMDCHLPYRRWDPWYKERDEQLAHLRAAYDSDICYLDDQIRQMADRFKWKENTLIVFTSDHGEEFAEHGKGGHGQAVFRESIQVPLMFYLPGGTSHRKIQANVSTLDILPTIRDLLGLASDPANSGRSLTPFWAKGDPKLENRAIFSHLARFNKKKSDGLFYQHISKTVIFGKWQAINSVSPNRQFLFDWQNDPLEKTDLKEMEPFLFQRLNKKFIGFESNCFKLPSAMKIINLDDDKIKKLRTLGYL